LYDYLDDGYTLLFWMFQQHGAVHVGVITLLVLWMTCTNHGPAGHYWSEWSATTDDVMVIWIEGDGSTTLDATMLDGAGTIGNWIEPNATLGHVPFPMASPAAA
jgi:hypothetical protein